MLTNVFKTKKFLHSFKLLVYIFALYLLNTQLKLKRNSANINNVNAHSLCGYVLISVSSPQPRRGF